MSPGLTLDRRDGLSAGFALENRDYRVTVFGNALAKFFDDDAARRADRFFRLQAVTLGADHFFHPRVQVNHRSLGRFVHAFDNAIAADALNRLAITVGFFQVQAFLDDDQSILEQAVERRSVGAE